MKQFKQLMYVVGIVVVVLIVFYGVNLYGKRGLQKQLEAGKSAYNSGDMQGAISIFEAVYSKAAKSSVGKETAYYLGKSYLNIGDLEKSETYWNAVSGDKLYAEESLFNVADIQKDTNRIEEAVTKFEKLIKDYPKSELIDDAMLKLAVIHRQKNELGDAQKELSAIIEAHPESNLIGTVEQEMGNINLALLFSPQITEGSQEYVVKSGDSLYTIAQKSGTTIELIKKCNGLKSDMLKPNDKLKVITDKFSVVVDKSKNILTLKAGERVVKTYSVGTGVSGCTPAGTYKITNKLVNPPWHKPGAGVVPFGDKQNVLGTRWMGFNNPGYGIHGTWEPESIGQQSSAGCVRMKNEDVEELFEIVPSGTEVEIVE